MVNVQKIWQYHGRSFTYEKHHGIAMFFRHTVIVQKCFGNVVLHELQYNGINQSTMVLSIDTIVVPWYYCGKSKENVLL